MLAFLLGGCSTVNVAGLSPDQDHVTRTFVGVVQVKSPTTEGRLSAVDVKTLGLGWDAGPYLGWKAGNWISADPAQCALVIIIRSPAEADNAAKVIRSPEGEDACIADFTRS